MVGAIFQGLLFRKGDPSFKLSARLLPSQLVALIGLYPCQYFAPCQIFEILSATSFHITNNHHTQCMKIKGRIFI